MKFRAFIIAVALATLVQANPARAQSQRSFVSGHGTDSGVCTIATPCRTFAYAITQTNAGGEIAVLDTAGYGSAIITKAINIIAPDGIEAGIAVPSGGTGVTITAGTNDVVKLRGITISGGGTGATGINYTSGGQLIVKNCTVRDMQSYGIHASGNKMIISDSQIAQISSYAILFDSATTESRLDFYHLEVYGSASGVRVVPQNTTSRMFVTGADSLLSGNSFGLDIAGNTSLTIVTIDNLKLSNNSAGISSTDATVYLSRTTIAGNNIGIQTFGGGVFKSYQNNQFVDGNGSSTVITPISPN
jgi:hypothetical protein